MYTLHFLENLQKLTIIPHPPDFFLIGLFFTIKNPHLPIFAGKKKFFAQKKFNDFFARAPKFPKIFRAQNLEKLTRPENFGAPHGRPTTRDEILRRDPKF